MDDPLFRHVDHTSSTSMERSDSDTDSDHNTRTGTQTVEKKARFGTRHRITSRDRHFFFSQLSNLTPHICSPAVERLNTQSQFFSLYMSKDDAQFPGCVFFAENARDHNLMQLALDTLSLLAMGASSGRASLTNEGLRMYPKILQRFRRQLNVTPIPDPFVLLQTIHVIQLCEMFHVISVDGWGWSRHMVGLDAVIQGASFEGRVECGERGRDLIERDNRISFPLWDGLLGRKDLGTAQELFFTTGHRPDADMASRLVIDREVPGILRYSQHVAQQGVRASESAVADAVGAIVGMEGRLHAAMTRWYAQLPSMSYRTIKTDSLEGLLFSSTKQAHPFPYALVFPNMAYALKHVHYWLCLLALRQAHVEIRTLVRPTRYSLSLYESIEILLHRTSECANNLCMSIIFMTLSRNGLFGRITAIPALQMAARWFIENGDTDRLAWCHNVARRLRSCGLAVPSELFPTTLHNE